MTATGGGAPPVQRAYIGIGSNLEDPARQVSRALRALQECPSVRLVARSGLYRSPPAGPVPQPDFVNAVAAVDTSLDPRALLAALLGIESGLGRVRGAVRWGPRIIDLDLLLHGALEIHEAGLELPHPRMGERAFVLVPLAEIAPRLQVPGHGTVEEMHARLGAPALAPIDEAALDLPAPGGRCS